MKPTRKSYPSDVSDEEWSFCAPYLTLMKEEAPQRDHPLREVFDALRWFVRAGCPWRMMPNDLPPWHVVYQQTQRWIKARCFEAMAHDLRVHAPEKKLVIEVNSASEGLAAATAGFDVIQAEKFTPEMVGELASLLAAMTRRPLIAAAGGVTPDNAGAYVRAGADILVTSWPYTARPADVAVRITPAM